MRSKETRTITVLPARLPPLRAREGLEGLERASPISPKPSELLSRSTAHHEDASLLTASRSLATYYE